ncbi:MAG: hypothetical protein L0229_06735 [Blastocatellia bacterium]|nr:hypothetical protein [Blastocatellia bacterium]
MSEETANPLIVEGVDISHSRLVDLTLLADHAQAFYEWVTSRFQLVLKRKKSLNEILQKASRDEMALSENEKG